MINGSITAVIKRKCENGTIKRVRRDVWARGSTCVNVSVEKVLATIGPFSKSESSIPLDINLYKSFLNLNNEIYNR